MSRKLAFLVVPSIALFSCKPKLETTESDVKAFPKNQPLSFKMEPTITCDTANVSPTVKLNHPVTGKDLTLVYKNSTQADYLRMGWENRIEHTQDFFSDLNLGGYNSDEMKATVIDIRNVNGKPHYHYFSNGTALQTAQNLSSTKFMGASFSVHRLRQLSGGKIGADIRYNTRVFAHDLDMIGKVSDNQTAAAIKTMGGNNHADYMIENYLMGGKRDASITGSPVDYFGGSWGTRSDLCEGQDFPPKKVKDLTSGEELVLPTDRGKYRNWNHMSGLTFAEWMKRMAVNYRDPVTLPKMIDYKVARASLPSVEARKNAKPSLTKRDLEILFYGTAAYSKQEFNARDLNGKDCGGKLGPYFTQYGGQPRGGMMWDGLRDWPHNAGGVDRLDKLFGKKWRTLGKGGASPADGKESVIGYICLPKIVKNSSVVFPGREMVVQLHFTNKGREGNNYTHVHNAARSIMEQMVPGLVTGGELGEIGTGKPLAKSVGPLKSK